MAVVEQIQIDGDTSGFQKQIDALNKKVEELEALLGGAGRATNELGKDSKKTGAIINKAFNGLKKVVTAPFDLAKKAANGLGNLLKGGLGFGVILAVVDKASEAFNQNQKVVDALNKVLTTASIIFNQIAEAIFGAVDEQSKLNGGFGATKKVLGGLISGVLNVFVGIIQGIKLAVQEVQLAWEQSFFGDKDANRIKELNEQIAQTREELKQTGENLLESGKMVVENLAEAASEVANTVVAVAQSATKAIQNLDVAKATSQAERLIKLQKQAALADVARQKIQLEFQNTQEQLRQLRDDEQKSLEERQKANDQLLESLQEQARLERQQLNIKVAAAAAEYEINKTNENLIALLQAQLELTDLDERLQGQKSEALSNQNSLLREQLDINRSVAETDQEIFEIKSQSQLDAIRNELKRAEKEIEIAQSVFDRKKSLLEQEVAAAKEGTAARAEAENALRLFEEEGYANKLELERNLADVRRGALQQTFDLTAQSLGAFADLYSALASDNEANAERAFRVNKALQLASAIASTAAAVTAQLAVPQDALTGANFVKAGIALTTGLAQVATISKTQFQPDGQSPNPVQSSIPSIQSQPAQFNIVGQSNINQLAQSIGGQFQQPIRAYVVGGEVTTAQQLERQRVRTATFG
jgi:hypothetical protein